MKNIIPILFYHKTLLLFAFLFGSLGYFLEGITDSVLLKLLIDEGIMKKNFKIFILICFLLIFSILIFRLISFSYNLLIQKIKNNITRDLSLLMSKNYFFFHYTEVIKNGSGYFISRIYDEPSKIATMTIDIFFSLMAFIGFLASFGFCLYLSFKITLVLLIIFPLLHFLSQKFSIKIREVTQEEKEAEGKLREIIGVCVNSYIAVKIFDALHYVHKKLSFALDNFIKYLYLRFKTSLIFSVLSRISLNYGHIVVIILAGYETIMGNLSLGGLLGFLTAFEYMVGFGGEIINNLPEIAQLVGYVERLKEFKSKFLKNPAVKVNSKGIFIKNMEFLYGSKKYLKILI